MNLKEERISMSDFCLQCSEDLKAPEGWSDFSGLSREKDTKQGYFSNVLCEGCGPIQVDHKGRCVAIGCLKEHNKSEV